MSTTTTMSTSTSTKLPSDIADSVAYQHQAALDMLDNPMPHADFAISFTASLVSPSFLDPQTLRRLADTARLALGFHPDHHDAQGARRFILAAEVLTDR